MHSELLLIFWYGLETGFTSSQYNSSQEIQKWYCPKWRRGTDGRWWWRRWR